MSQLRVLIPITMLVALFLVAGCASTPAEQLASRDCKIAVADFPGKPAKNVTPAEQAAAEMRISRLAYARGGYGIGTNLLADAARDCY
jgi:hypothetical protein